jgi:hypothetical protein
MVEKLELLMTPHPRPYSLRRCHEKIDITHQTMVSFSIGKFSCDVLCDVIPMTLVSCHLLLEEPWYKSTDAAYDCRAKGDKVYVFGPLEEKLFRAWRKERLRQKKKIAAEAILMAPIHSIGEDIANITDLKPMTVFFEEREDDMAPTSIVENYFQLNKNNQRKMCTLESKPHVYGSMRPCTVVGFLHVNHLGKGPRSSTYMRDCVAAHQFIKESNQSRQEDRGCNFFGRSRPPELGDATRFQSWSSQTLHEVGWGPPACIGQHDQVILY